MLEFVEKSAVTGRCKEFKQQKDNLLFLVTHTAKIRGLIAYFFIYYCLVQKYFSSLPAAAATASVTAAAASPGAPSIGAVVPAEIQLQMVQQFSVQSGMNLDWSTRSADI